MSAGSAWFPSDGGPIYAETPRVLAESQFLIEPWNAISSLLIIAPAIYFLFQLRGKYRSNWFLVLCIPLLILGGTGSTLFHAFRSSSYLLDLDVWPTAILFLAVSTYFWAKALKNWWAALGIMVAFFATTMAIFAYFPPKIQMNTAYLLRGLAFFVPVALVLVKTKFQEWKFILGGLIAFTLALTCRLIDHETTSILPMGSHFLWHAFTGLGGFWIAEYLLRMEAKENVETVTS